VASDEVNVARDEVRITDPSLVVLVGAAGSGKSTWAAERFGANQIVSSDALRAAVGRDESDLDASDAAFDILRSIVTARCARRLMTVVDTLGFDASLRAWLRELGDASAMPVVAVVMDTPAAVCRSRNAGRDKRVPAAVLTAQLHRIRAVRDEVAAEGFAGVHTVSAEVAAGSSARIGSDAAPAASDGALRSPSKSGLRFGLHLSSFPWSAAQHRARITEVAQSAEAAGFDSLWVMDHFRQIPQIGREWDDMYESTTTLSHLAAATSRLTLGPLVAAVTHRNLAVLGKTIATIDVLSGGRAVCGLGLGWFADEHRSYGLALPSVSERYELLEDALRFLPVLWGKGAPAFEGKRFSTPSAICYPRPLQARIPVLVGGSGERTTLRLAAQYGDACNLFGDPDIVERRVAALHRWCDELGRDRAAVEVTHLSTVVIGRTSKELSETMTRLKIPPKMIASQHPGTIVDHVERAQSLRSVGVQHIIVSTPSPTPDSIAAFGAVIAEF
jgi:alkanesulfonate monooxygenase SsuD/methylene tetrahydromethanopterin reductase-like flavin-dependent oxidoreductase (luciferase family)/predicted kinase